MAGRPRHSLWLRRWGHGRHAPEHIHRAGDGRETPSRAPAARPSGGRPSAGSGIGIHTGPATGMVDAGNLNMEARAAGSESVRSRARVEAFSGWAH